MNFLIPFIKMDPLSLVSDECRKRCLEIYAWKFQAYESSAALYFEMDSELYHAWLNNMKTLVVMDTALREFNTKDRHPIYIEAIKLAAKRLEIAYDAADDLGPKFAGNCGNV